MSDILYDLDHSKLDKKHFHLFYPKFYVFDLDQEYQSDIMFQEYCRKRLLSTSATKKMLFLRRPSDDMIFVSATLPMS